MAIAFDTLKFVRRLTEAGLPEKQAEVFADAHTEAFGEVLDARLATKTDIAELRGDIAEFREAMRGEFAEFKEAMRGEIAELRSDMTEFKEFVQGEINRLDRRIDRLASEMRHLKWILIFNLGVTMTILWKAFS